MTDFEKVSDNLRANDKKSVALLVEELLNKKDFKSLKLLSRQIEVADIAEITEELPGIKALQAFRLLPKELAALSFVEMNKSTRRKLIEGFTDSELAEILEELYSDDTVQLIDEMPASVVKRILRIHDKARREEINKLLNYPRNSAGSVMTTEYVSLKPDMTADNAIYHMRRVAIDSEDIYTCYVTDNYRTLLGTVSAKELLISKPSSLISSVMKEHFVYVYTTDSREEVSRKLAKYNLLSIPVVDGEKRLVGIITVDDAIDVINEESEEDFAKMAAITPNGSPYLKTSIIGIWRLRIPWLLILLVSATFTSAILQGFEEALPSSLFLFVPMLMDTGGNSGSQSSVTVIRGISLSEIKPRDFTTVLIREGAVGFLCGLSLGAVALLKIIIVDSIILQNPLITVKVALTVSLSVFITVVIAKLIGASMPLLVKRLGRDPAVVASPFITTVVDTLSLVLYFVISSLILQ